MGYQEFQEAMANLRRFQGQFTIGAVLRHKQRYTGGGFRPDGVIVHPEGIPEAWISPTAEQIQHACGVAATVSEAANGPHPKFCRTIRDLCLHGY